MSLDLNDMVSLALLVLGLGIAGFGLRAVLRCVIRPGVSTPTRRPLPRAAWFLGLGLSTVSLGLGLEGIERRGMSHVEVYVPGLELPGRISEPPARHDLLTTIRYHVHREPHPQAYYLLMWGWIKVAGTSLTAIRLPSVVFGALGVFFTFLLGTRLLGWQAGAIAGGLLALNGHHVFWTQHARMYEMSLLLAVLSLWLLVKILDGERHPINVVGYIAITTLGVYTQEYFWPFLAGQMGYALLARPHGTRHLLSVAPLQLVAWILGSPMWAHAVYKAQYQPNDSTTFSFAQDLFNFGFLFRPYDWPASPVDIPRWPEWGLTGLALILLIAFLRTPGFRWNPRVENETIPPGVFWSLGIGFSVVLLALSREVYSRNVAVGLTAIVPIVAVGLYSLALKTARWTGVRDRGPVWSALCSTPLTMVVAITTVLTFTIGLITPFLVSRGLLVIVAPLLLLLGAGLWSLARRSPPLGTALFILILGFHLWSIAYHRSLQRPRDYRGLASRLAQSLQPGDLIFVKKSDWVIAPIFYHLPREFDRLVAEGYQNALQATDAGRVWYVHEVSQLPEPAMTDALAGLVPAGELSTLRMRATLFERPRKRP